MPASSDFISQQPTLSVEEQPNTTEPSDNQTVPDNTAAPSLESAIQIIQNRDQNPDLAYTDFGEGTDEHGAYRKLQITSISIREQGGSGTAGFAKVYGDGTVLDSPYANF